MIECRRWHEAPDSFTLPPIALIGAAGPGISRNVVNSLPAPEEIKRKGDDLPAFARRYAPRTDFARLRNAAPESDGSFVAAPHPAADNDMATIAAVLPDAKARMESQNPFRPEHGHVPGPVRLSDHYPDAHPGYPPVGRVRGSLATPSHPATIH